MISLNELLNTLPAGSPAAQVPNTSLNTVVKQDVEHKEQPTQLAPKESEVNLLSAPLSAVQAVQVWSTDLTALANFEDSIDYMNRIEAMPPLADLIDLYSKEAADAALQLNSEQSELLSLVHNELGKIEESIDLKQIDTTVSAIMERLQENPEVLNCVQPKDMRILINSFDRLYATKSAVSSARKEKAAEKRSNKAKQLAFLEDLDNELDI
jgi:hypothetical protein